MKLIYAIVSSDDSSSVSGALTQNGFFATKLASTGGFLMAGNTTFLICTDDENVDRVISIIAEHSKSVNRWSLLPQVTGLALIRLSL